MEYSKTKKSFALLAAVLLTSQMARAQEPGRVAVPDSEAPWIVSVVHATDLSKLLERIREKEKIRVGVPANAPEQIFNVATGLVIDNEGHVVTRLANLDPSDRSSQISIATSSGDTLPARLVGLDGPTGFAILEVPLLKVDPPHFVGGSDLADGLRVKILSTDVRTAATPNQKGRGFSIPHATRMTLGMVSGASEYSKATGTLTLVSNTLLSRNDGSVVTTLDDRVVGMAQYAGFGRAYLYPVEAIRDSIARRVIQKKDSVHPGWLGAVGVSIGRLNKDEIRTLKLDRNSGVIVREVLPNSPAAAGGLKPSDVIVGFDDLEVRSTADLKAMLSASPSGRSVRLRTLRDNNALDITVVLGSGPEMEPKRSVFGLEAQLELQESQRLQLEKRVEELGRQYRHYLKSASSPDRNETLLELDLEIRRLHDILRELHERKQEQAPTAEAIVEPAALEPRAESMLAVPLDQPCDFASAGFQARELTEQLASYLEAPGGLLVTNVTQGSTADTAGIKAGDVIAGTDSQNIRSCHELEAGLSDKKDSLIKLTVVRNRATAVVELHIK